MIIKPYSSIVTNSSLAQTIVNFPAIRHFWKCDEQTSLTNYTLVDCIGGANLVSGDVITSDGNGITNPGPCTIAGNALTSPESTDCFFFVIAKHAGVPIYGASTGGAGNGGISLAQAAPKVYDGTTTLPATAFTNGGATIYGRGIAVDFGGNATTMECTSTTTTSIKAGAANTVASINTVTQAAALSNGAGAVVYMAGFMMFTSGLPALQHLMNGLSWMTKTAAVDGNKVIYPGFKGMS